VRLIVPVVMGAACVNCHNAHPEKPEAGTGRSAMFAAFRKVTITQATASNIFSFKYLLSYFALMAACGTTFIGLQRRQAATIKGMNGELETANEFLASLSMKISRYLSPQIYKSIFSGQKDVTIHTERKEAHDLLLRHQGLYRDPLNACSPSRPRSCSTNISPRCRPSRYGTAARSTSLSATPC